MIILTGGAGFIGSIVLAALNELGKTDILVVDNLGSSDKWKNLAGKSFSDYVHKDHFRVLVADDLLPDDVETVIHLGACSSTTERDADYMMSNNYSFSRELAQWAVTHNARFLYASSAATYGDGSQGFSDATEELSSLYPLNVYAFSKQAFDLWARDSGLLDVAVGLKFFNVFGPNEYHKEEMRSVVHKSFHQVLAQGHIELFRSDNADYKDGEQKRDFIYVKDCARVICWLLDRPSVTGLYNLGTGQARTWNDLATAVFQAMGKKPDIRYIDLPENLRGKYQYFTEADMSKLRAAGFTEEFTSLEDAVKEYVQAYLQSDKQYA